MSCFTSSGMLFPFVLVFSQYIQVLVNFISHLLLVLVPRSIDNIDQLHLPLSKVLDQYFIIHKTNLTMSKDVKRQLCM